MSIQETGIRDYSARPIPEHKPISYDGLTSQLRFLSGDVLTIIDAVFPDNDQRKAIKDLVRHAFRDRHRHLGMLCFGYDPNQPCEAGSSTEHQSKTK